MFHGIIVNKKINHLHERVVRIVYKDYASFFFFFEHFVKREQVVLNTYLKEKILSLFIVGTFSHWL